MTESSVAATAAQDELTDDGFFQDLANSKPYLKVSFLGFAGAGKTRTMSAIAIGLHKRIRSTKPIVSFDTEEALHACKPLFDAAGIRVLRKSSRSLSDLMEVMKRCRDGMSDILLIDSISHVWEDVLRSYMRKKNRARLEFADWNPIKKAWHEEFSDPFVRDPYHTLMTGRAGFQYEDEKDEDGKRQIYKSGIKMKVEGETAYEPDMLVLMERQEELIGKSKAVWREATILKDRSELIDGKVFKNPTYNDFAPAVERLLDSPAWRLPVESDAAELFGGSDERKEFAIARDVALEKLQGELTSAWPGQTADAKRGKVDALQYAFGTKSWTEIKNKKPEELTAGCARIVEYVEQQREAAEKAAQ